MTEAKSTRRRRRTTAATQIPTVLAEWFAGNRVPTRRTSETPWLAMIYPHGDLLSMRWEAWKEAHPTASPPAGYEWLEDPDSLRHPSPMRVARALACANASPIRA